MRRFTAKQKRLDATASRGTTPEFPLTRLSFFGHLFGSLDRARVGLIKKANFKTPAAKAQ
ncbi:hypothetical protein [Undibacterium sp.]|uniref:hypothetical protein n=1 Tax=Undibacterium sp. TaxID=1914977 RepID=UPI0025DB3F1E|nr:hypothetical protein [Undibacterium sp.]